ncbi:MAG: hypothetical protein UZ02_AOB001001803, partial [Nitrosomonas europaea]
TSSAGLSQDFKITYKAKTLPVFINDQPKSPDKKQQFQHQMISVMSEAR